MSNVVPFRTAYENAQTAQRDAARPDRSAWAEAHAGSGKTKVLIDRVARLLLRRPDGRKGAAPDTILCVTYTKAAANEMLSRLFSQLGGWSVARDADLRRELSKLEHRDESAYSTEDLEAARALFAQALETPGGLRIETIHAFCSRILRRFPLEARVSPGFGEIEEREADQLWNEALKDQILDASETAPGALSALSEAGGGNGAAAILSSLRSKRGELTGRDADRLKAEVRVKLDAPEATSAELIERAMGADFPRAEVLEAFRAIDDLPKRGRDDAALHKHLLTALSDSSTEERWASYSAVFLTDAGKWRAKHLYTKTPSENCPQLVNLFQIKDGDGSETARFRALLGRLKARRAYELTSALLDIGLPVLASYASGKRQRAALDFDDLIQRAKDLLTSPGVAEWVLFKLDGGLTHILLDEAQDTSPNQWTVINALVAEFRAGKGPERAADPRTQFTVGDKKQSIYSFQGADPDRFLSEKQAFIAAEEALHPQANIPDMTMSFRSTPQVLGFVDAVFNQAGIDGDPFSQNPPDKDDQLKHIARRSNQSGRVDLWPVEAHKDEEETDPWDAPLDHLSESSPKTRLANKLACEIRAMIDRCEPVWHEVKDGQGERRWQQRPVKADDFLILVRKRGLLFEALIRALKDAGLPVAGADRLVLLDHIAVQDCLNLIRFALFPGDDLVLAEILRGPFCGLIDDNMHLYPLARGRKGESLWQRLKSSDTPLFAPARTFCEDLIAHAHLPAFEFLTRALTARREDGLSGWDHLIRRLKEPARDPVNALVSHALGFDMGEAASLQAFLAEIESDTSQLKRDLAEADGEIRVMTVHGAKGLQAPVVILPDTTGREKADTSGLFMLDGDTPVISPRKADDPPSIERARAARDEAQLRESRRLLYVALTRAQDRLIISGAHFGSKSGSGFVEDSWYALCRTAMLELTGGAPDTEAEILVYGEPLPPVASTDTGPVDIPPAPKWTKTPAHAGNGVIPIRAPSQLLKDRAPVARPFGTARRAALKRGQLIHTLLQYLPELPETEREAAATSYLARHTDLETGERSEILAVTLQTLAAPGFEHVFAPGGRSEAAIVGRIETDEGGLIINGRADRLIISDHEILIIDYKTDRPAPACPEDVDPSYLRQMAAYKMVLEKAWEGRTVRAALLYTDGPKLFELNESLLQNS